MAIFNARIENSSLRTLYTSQGDNAITTIIACNTGSKDLTNENVNACSLSLYLIPYKTRLNVVKYITDGIPTVDNKYIITGIVDSTAGFLVGEVINISSTVGVQQTRLNGSWSITQIVNETTFRFEIENSINSGEYSTGLGVTEKYSAASDSNVIVKNLLIPAGETVFFSDEKVILSNNDRIEAIASPIIDTNLGEQPITLTMTLSILPV